MYALLKFDLPSAAVAAVIMVTAAVLVRIIHYTTIQSFCILILCDRYPFFERPRFPSHLMMGMSASACAFNRQAYESYELHLRVQRTNCEMCNERAYNH